MVGARSLAILIAGLLRGRVEGDPKAIFIRTAHGPLANDQTVHLGRRGMRIFVVRGVDVVNRAIRGLHDAVAKVVPVHEFVDDKYGTTWGHFLASAEDYGADKLWVVLELIPIQLDSDDD